MELQQEEIAARAGIFISLASPQGHHGHQT